MNTAQLAAQARAFVNILDEMGFGTDGPINGGDVVEVIDQQQHLLRRLPALAELAEAVDRIRDHSVNDVMPDVLAALAKVKAEP